VVIGRRYDVKKEKCVPSARKKGARKNKKIMAVGGGKGIYPWLVGYRERLKPA
jgi:hypothetical protein